MPTPMFALNGLRLALEGNSLVISSWNGDPLTREQARITNCYLTGLGERALVVAGSRATLDGCDAILKLLTKS